MTTSIDKATIRERIEKIMEKHTVALTKTGVEPEIISFDTVVLNQYEATNDILEVFSNLRSDLLAQIERELGKLPVIYLGSHPVFKKQGVESGYYIEKDDVLQALKHLKENV